MAETTIKSRAKRYFFWVALIFLTLLVLLVFAGFAFFSTQTGRVWTTEKALDFVSNSEGLNFRYSDIRSDSFGHFYFDELKIYQQKAPFVFASRLELRWRPTRLLSGKIVVDALTANSIKVFKPPAAKKPAEQKEAKVTRLPENFSLPNITLRKLQIDNLDLKDLVGDASYAALLEAEVRARARTTAKNVVETSLWLRSDNEKPLELKFNGEQKTISPDKPAHYAISLSINEEDHGLLANYLKLPEDESFSAKLRALLSYGDASLEAALEELSLPLSGYRILADGSLSLNETLKPLQLSSDLSLSIDDTVHSVKGELTDTKIDYAVKLNQLPLGIAQPWVQDLNNGSVSANLSVVGDLQSPKATGELSANTTYKGNALAAELTGEFEQDVIVLASSRLKLNDSIVTAQGKFFVMEQSLNAQINGKNLKLANVKALKLEEYGLVIPKDLQLEIPQLQAKLRGPVKRPLGRATLEGNGAYQSIEFDFNADVNNTDVALIIDEFVINTAGGQSRLLGNLNIDTLESDLRLRAQELPLTLLEAAQIQLPPNFKAILSADADISGKLTAPKVNGELLLSGTYDELPFVLDAQGKYIDQEVKIDKATLVSGDNQLLSAQGFYKDKNFNFDLNIDELPTKFFENFGWAPYAGTLYADLNLAGSIEAPRLNGSASYSTQTTIIDEENRNQTVPLSMQLKANTDADSLNLDASFLREDTRTGSLKIVIPTEIFDNLAGRMNGGVQQLPISASINGEVDLKAIGYLALSDLNRLDGSIEAALTLGGSVAAPDIDGKLKINDAYYENFVTGTVLDKFNCVIDSKNSSFTLSDCTARDGASGRLELSGSFDLPVGNDSLLPDAQTIDLALRLRNFSPIEQPDIEAEVSGEVDAKGNFDRLYVSGAIDVSPLNIDISSSFGSDIPSIEVKEVYDLAELEDEDVEKAPSRPEIFLDLTVNAEKQAYLHGRGIEVELGGKIKINGTANNIKYNGKFETLRGTAELFGKNFDITQGEVRFVDSQFSMFFKAEYEKSGQKIVAEISGSNDELDLELSATPSMAEDEILAFILFGKSVANMTPFEAVQLAGAVQKLRGGKSTFDPIGSARDLLDVDTLSVSSEETEDGESGLNIGIGKYINERVYLEFERTPDPSQPWRGRLEIQLLPNLILESSTGGKTGVAGAQLKWTRDY